LLRLMTRTAYDDEREEGEKGAREKAMGERERERDWPTSSAHTEIHQVWPTLILI
jgi:hypothetical protein